MNLENKKFYDINKNRVTEIAGAFLEEGVYVDIKQRINISELYPESRINQDNWEYNKHSNKEKEATLNIFELGKSGQNIIIWISPEDGGDVYKEGRLNIEFPVYGENEWSIYGKHSPLLLDENDSYNLALKLIECGGKTVSEISCKEEVRCQPIGFSLDENSDWIEFCKELMPDFDDIWDFIDKGGDVENKIRMEKDVMVAMTSADGDNYLFEEIMYRMGNMINEEGGHGSSWGGGGEFGMIVSLNSQGEYVYNMGKTDGLTLCKKCGCYYSGEECPLCH